MEKEIKDLTDTSLFKSSDRFAEIESIPLKNFVIWVSQEFKASPEKISDTIEDSDRVIEIVMKYLIDAKKYYEGNPRTWIDVLYAATYIRYLTFDFEEPITSLFRLREIVMREADFGEPFMGVDAAQLSAVLDTIECGAGPKTLVTKCAPVPNSPQQVWSDAIWYHDNFGA